MENNDWRLQGQEKYLYGVALTLKQYRNRKTSTDHDHCEFCGKKFSENVTDSLFQGYATNDDYRWVCENCYKYFKKKFNWNL